MTNWLEALRGPAAAAREPASRYSNVCISGAALAAEVWFYGIHMRNDGIVPAAEAGTQPSSRRRRHMRIDDASAPITVQCRTFRNCRFTWQPRRATSLPFVLNLRFTGATQKSGLPGRMRTR